MARQYSYVPAGGIDSSGSYTWQYSFAPTATQIRLGGVAMYQDNLPNWSEFTNLFDQYRIRQVTVRVDYSANTMTNSGVAYTAPIIYAAVDYDDESDATANALFQYPGCITHSFIENGYKPLIINFKPRPLRDVAGIGVLTGYSPMARAPFIRVADNAIPHYGLKMALNLQGASANVAVGYFNIQVAFDLELINPK